MRTATILSHDRDHIQLLEEIIRQATNYRNGVQILPTIQVGQLEVRTRPTNDNIAEEFIIETEEKLYERLKCRVLDITSIIQELPHKDSMGQPMDADNGYSEDTGKEFSNKKERNSSGRRVRRTRN